MRPESGVFVTATDTGAGKTVASLGLMAALAGRGHRAAGMKPVASGSQPGRDGALHNADALLLQARGPAGIPYADINPYALREPIAPHLAAARAGVRIDLDRIESAFRRLAARADGVIVEGIGGWRVPLNDAESTADLVRRLELPVILVVGLRLGCINHALLTAEAIRRDGVELRGWIANGLDPAYETAEETVEFLEQRLDAPRIGSIPRLEPPSADRAAGDLDVRRII
jgi:dethiobiotin synthetase